MTDVTISKKEYDELIDAKMKLDALEAEGVDNWEWYDAALDEYEEMVRRKDKIKEA